MRDGCVRAAVAVTPEGRPPAPHVHGAQTLLSCRGVGSARLLDAGGGGCRTVQPPMRAELGQAGA